MTESKTSILYRTLPKLLFFFGLLSIVYLGYTLHLTQQQYGQPQLTVGTEPPPTPYPMFYDPKKLDRKPAADRYLHQFNYNGTVWPFPHDHKIGDDFVPIKGIILAISSDSKQCDIFESAIDRYDRIIQSMISNSEGVDVSAVKYTIKIVVTNCEIKPSPSMDEEYKLVIHKHHGEIKANSEWGMLRALETLAQVISTVNGKPGLVTQQVHDWPEYKHRGLMVDTARHFLPMTILKQLITSLSWNKLNVMHWHIVDQQSFPFQSEALPDLPDKGAYTQFKHVYSIGEIRDLIEFARQRGVRIIPEFDTPGHIDAWGPGGGDGFRTPCYDYHGEPDGTLGPIDPTREENFKIINTLIGEIKDVFADDYLHLGGDEVKKKCWQLNPDIMQWMNEHDIRNVQQLQGYWIERMINMTQSHKLNYVVWEEVFSDGAKMNSDAIVHVWKGWSGFDPHQTMQRVIHAGYKTIISQPWYFDWHERGPKWMQDYIFDPQQGFNPLGDEVKSILGGEACMWTEFVDASNIFALVYPRLNAVAERLWSSRQQTMSPTLALPRLHSWNCKLRERALPVSPAIYNTNDGQPWLGYCRRPFDPFEQDFFF